MKYETYRHEKRIRIWHRKYAWLPRDINGTTVWFGYYWARFVDVKIDSRHALDFAITCFMIGKRAGQWEFSVGEPPIPDNVVQIKKAS